MEICAWITGVLLLLFLFCCAVWSIVYAFSGIKCFKIRRCTSEKCLIRYLCEKWEEVYTEEERAVLERLLEELKEVQKNRRIIDSSTRRREDRYWKIIENISYGMVCLAALSFIGTVIWIIVMGIRA